MSTISGVSSAKTDWAALRSQMQAKMFAKADADSSGDVSKTELQSLFTEAAQKTGSTVSSTDTDALFSKMDSDGNGSLTSAELGKGMESLMAPPPPPSTMDFAQSRSGATGSTGSAGDDLFSKIDSDGNGAVSKDELQSLMDKMAADGKTDGTSASDKFASLDTDGNGSLTQSEFDAGRPSGPPPGGGMPPTAGAGGGGGGGTSATSSSTDSTTYDALDTNKDGVVSLIERLAASSTESTDPVQALLAAIDTDKDGKVNSSESNAFVKQLTELVAKADSSSTTASDASSKQETDLAKLARQLYDQVASSLSQSSQGSTLSATA